MSFVYIKWHEGWTIVISTLSKIFIDQLKEIQIILYGYIISWVASHVFQWKVQVVIQHSGTSNRNILYFL